jgi:hypothetical protein
VGLSAGSAGGRRRLQALHISNQNVVYALAPQARSRINAVYMTTYFSAPPAARHWALGLAAPAGPAPGPWRPLGLLTLAMVLWDRQPARVS